MKMLKRLISLILVTSLSTLLFTGCSKSQNASEGKEHVELIATISGIGGILTAIPLSAGYYDEENLEVNVNPSSNLTDTFTALQTDKIMGGSLGGAAVLNYIDGGADIVIIGGQMSEGAALFILPENASEYDNYTYKTFYGKKIGIIGNETSTGSLAISKWVKENGGDNKKINFITFDSQSTIIQAVKKGEIDAGIVHTINRDKAELEGLKVVLYGDDLLPQHICCRFITSRKNIEENRETLVKILRAQIKAYKLLQNDPDKSVDSVVDFMGVDKKLLKGAIYDYGHLTLSPDPDKKHVEQYYKAMIDTGVAKGEKNIDDYIDTSIYEEALNGLLQEEPNEPAYIKLKEYFDENNK